MKLRTWPAAAKYSGPELAIVAHSRGGQGRGGHYAFVRGKGAAWAGRLGVVSLGLADAFAFRAFLHSLRGRSGSFYLNMPAESSTPAVGALSATASAGASTLAVTSAIWGSALCKAGAFLTVGDVSAGGQLLRIVEVSGSNLTVRPHLRAAQASGAAVVLGRCSGLFRLDQETPIVPLIVGRSLPVEVRIAEVY